MRPTEIKDQDVDPLPSFSVPLLESTNEGANFQTENDPQNPLQRSDIIDRQGSVYVSCECKEAVHGLYDSRSRDPSTLIVLEFRFEQRDPGCRIKNVQIDIAFSAMNRNEFDPEVVKAYPEGVYEVHPMTQQESRSWEASGTLGGNVLGAAELSGTVKRTSAVTREVVHASILTGSIVKSGGRNYGPKNAVFWSLLENPVEKAGVPHLMQSVILLKRTHNSKFKAHFKVVANKNFNAMAKAMFKSDPNDDPVLFSPKLPPTNNLREYKGESLENLGKLSLDGPEFWMVDNRKVYGHTPPK